LKLRYAERLNCKSRPNRARGFAGRRKDNFTPILLKELSENEMRYTDEVEIRCGRLSEVSL
jgi:hypothetical protein